MRGVIKLIPFLWRHWNVNVSQTWNIKNSLCCCCCCCCCVTPIVSDSVRPRRRQPTRLPCPWDSPGKNTGVGCHFLLQCMKGKSESEVAQSCPTLSDPMDCSPPAPPSMGFSRQEYWSGVPLPSPKKPYSSFYFTKFGWTLSKVST